MPVLHLPQSSRGCGTRVMNGLYAFFDVSTVESCHNLPLPLPPACPCCGEEIIQCRGLKMVNPKKLLPPVKVPCGNFMSCPVCVPKDTPAGLFWVGSEFYTPDSFAAEARIQGISKRIAKKPGHLKIGDWVYFVHPKAIRVGQSVFDEENVATKRVHNSETKPGIFIVAKLTAFHKIINEEKAKDEKFIQSLEDQGIIPVIEDLPVEQPKTFFRHIKITDDTPRDELEGISYRGSCAKCGDRYGYNEEGKNPKYCPECLVAMNERGKVKPKKEVAKPKKETTKKKRTKKEIKP
jgi:hypothetical protein